MMKGISHKSSFMGDEGLVSMLDNNEITSSMILSKVAYLRKFYDDIVQRRLN